MHTKTGHLRKCTCESRLKRKVKVKWEWGWCIRPLVPYKVRVKVRADTRNVDRADFPGLS